MADQPLVLIVEDELTQLRMLESIIKRAGYRTESLMDGASAAHRLTDKKAVRPDVIILDQGLPQMTGIEVLEHIRPSQPDLPIIMLTAHSSISTVVDAMRSGANDFIVKPASAERIRTALTAALETSQLVGDVAPLSSGGAAKGLDGLIGASPSMIEAKTLAMKAAGATIPLLLEGESGVGKEVFARAVHKASNRSEGPFVAVNCGAIPENLVESILFGHEKGAFTGATEKRIGKFEEAAGGTLFLDEVGELPLDVQVKLLRALQEKEIDPVGARKSISVDIRVISATNRDLFARVSDGHFREDLYYRLNVFPVQLPPLRERSDDIPALVSHFLDQLAELEDLPRKRPGAELVRALQQYHWPGNVRQLQNAVFRAVVLSENDELDLVDFPALATARPNSPALPDNINPAATQNTPAATPAQPDRMHMLIAGEDGHLLSLADIEKKMIDAALKHYNGRMSEVARRLGIGRSTLYRKIEEFQLEIKN